MSTQQIQLLPKKVNLDLQQEWPGINTIQYMGSKSRIISPISNHLIDLGKEYLVDLFAGTGSVSYALKDRYKAVFANDYQQYSNIILEGILNGASFDNSQETQFWGEVEYIFNQTVNLIPNSIGREHWLFCQKGNYEDYKNFCESTPSALNPNTTDKYLQDLANLCRKVKIGVPQNRQNLQLPILFLSYYSNTYFGIRQCCEIDAVREAIEKLKDRRQQFVLLTALMSSMSVVASTTTHFAQFLKVRDVRTAGHLLNRRSQNIIDCMREKLREFRIKGLLNKTCKQAICGNEDYLEFLNRLPLNEKFLVYADPPYFKEHYSRYYHILETLCLYDYPEVTYNDRLNDYTTGRYRKERAVSPFGKKRSALTAFRDLVDTCRLGSASLAISYSDNSIVAVQDIVKVCEPDYLTKTVVMPLTHSGQGRSTANKVNEILIVCTPKRKYHYVGQAQVIKLLSELEDITPVYDSPVSAMHNYMARKPYNIVNYVIKNLLNQPGTVLDPFCGSGTTLIEAAKLGHKSVGVDLNQQAILISKASLTSWELDKVRKDVEAFINDVRESIKDLYSFNIDGETRYLERCHFDLENGNIKPTSYWYQLWDEKYLPRRKTIVDREFVQDFLSLEQKANSIYSDAKLLPNSRIAVAVGASVADYFCPRNRIAVKRVLDIFKTRYFDCYSKDIIELIISSALNLIKLSDKKASSQMPYWRPKTNLTSRNALCILEEKAEVILEGLEFLNQGNNGDVVRTFKELETKPHGTFVIKGAIQRVKETEVPSNSIDLVFTDPPYTDQVPYLEYSQLWSLLLGWDNLASSVLADEVIVSNAIDRKDKTLENFNQLMSQMFDRVSRAIKPRSYMVLFFHDFSLLAWSSLIQEAQNAGLAYQGQTRIGRQRRSFKTVLSPQRTLDGNYLIIFQKRPIHVPVFDGDINKAVQRSLSVARLIINESGGKATTQDLYDKGMLKDAIESGAIHVLASKYKTFLDVIKGRLAFNQGYWEE